ncbi:NPCBM/NEW2 domain-containing protein [Phytohabitans houttuyneae]|uniref:NPCBM/NEW2 domain-containing protein n=1 Tax=Phytohabitans houttuyneae TaxID=1076126 RepID=UPI00156594A7
MEPAYRRFIGTFGLADKTPQNDVIDGIVYFWIEANYKPPSKPIRVKYPAAINFDVDVTGANLIKLVVSDGDNGESPCWCNAYFE